MVLQLWLTKVVSRSILRVRKMKKWAAGKSQIIGRVFDMQSLSYVRSKVNAQQASGHGTQERSLIGVVTEELLAYRRSLYFFYS